MREPRGPGGPAFGYFNERHQSQWVVPAGWGRTPEEARLDAVEKTKDLRRWLLSLRQYHAEIRKRGLSWWEALSVEAMPEAEHEGAVPIREGEGGLQGVVVQLELFMRGDVVS